METDVNHIFNIYFWGKINHGKLRKTRVEKAHIFPSASEPDRAQRCTVTATKHEDLLYLFAPATVTKDHRQWLQKTTSLLYTALETGV